MVESVKSSGFLDTLDRSPITRGMLILAVLAAMGGFLDSYSLIAVGSATSMILAFKPFGLSPLDVSLANSMAFFGAIVTALILGYYSDKLLGRRIVFIVDMLLFVGSAILQALVTNASELIILRFVVGMAIGMDIPVAWSLIGETAPIARRGMLISFMFLFWVIGGFVTYAIALAVLPLGAIAWRVLLATQAVPAIIVFALRLRMPESPRWLMMQGRMKEAIASAKQLGVGVSSNVVATAKMQGKTSYGYLFRKYSRVIVFEAVFMFIFAATGLLLSLYPPTIFKFLGFAKSLNSSLTEGLITYGFMIAGMLACTFTIDKIGRKPLALMGSLGVAILLIILIFVPKTNPLLFASVFFIFAFVEVMGAWGPAWAYMSEIFPTEVRATGSGFIGTMNRVGAGIAAFGVPALLPAIGFTNLIWLFVIGNIVLFIVLYFYAIETRGLSLEEIAEKFKSD
ncbi:MAG: MFS transporter [Conexivisphaerales archaeon]